MKSLEDNILDFLRAYERQPLEGYSVYDAFNSPLSCLLKLNSRWVNVAVTQFFKNFPRDIRGILRFEKSINPKSLGLALEAALINGAPQSFIDRLLAKMDQTKSVFENLSWGYNWHYYTLRGGTFPKGYPNAIVTYFIGNSLLDYYNLRGRPAKYADMIESITRFFLQDLQRTEDDSGICFSYSPVDNKQIYNASALVTKFLITRNQIFGMQNHRELIDKCLTYLVRRQNEDGSWFYGESPNQQWVDSFHTEYMLELFAQEPVRKKYQQVYDKGRAYYYIVKLVADS